MDAVLHFTSLPKELDDVASLKSGTLQRITDGVRRVRIKTIYRNYRRGRFIEFDRIARFSLLSTSFCFLFFFPFFSGGGNAQRSVTRSCENPSIPITIGMYPAGPISSRQVETLSSFFFSTASRYVPGCRVNEKLIAHTVIIALR